MGNAASTKWRILGVEKDVTDIYQRSNLSRLTCAGYILREECTSLKRINSPDVRVDEPRQT